MITRNLLILTLLLSSCTNERSNTETDEKVVRETEASEDSTDLKQIKTVALSFHQWNIESISDEDQSIDIDFDIVQGDRGKCKLDSTNYFRNLRSLGTISEKFIQSEWKRVEKCSTFLKNLDWESFQDADAYEYQDYCDIYFYYWTRTQEPFHGVEVKEVKKMEDFYLVTLVFYHQYDEKNYSEYAFPVVKVEKENENWKITEITWKD